MLCRVTMHQTFVHRITSRSLRRTRVFELMQNLASRTLLWAGHVASMPKSRLPKIDVVLVNEPRIAGGQEINYGRSLQCHLDSFDIPLTFIDWGTLAQNRGAWRELMTKPPFMISKPFLRP